jgi:transketolase C-terminal domain/subunit
LSRSSGSKSGIIEPICHIDENAFNKFSKNDKFRCRVKRLGIPQVYAGFGSGEELRAKYGYDKAATVAAVKEMLK